MTGWKTFAYGVAIILLAAFDNAEVKAFIMENFKLTGGALGAIVIGLRFITRTPIFSKAAAPGKFGSWLVAALLIGGLGVTGLTGCAGMKADTMTKKWAVAQEAHIAASDTVVVLIENRQITKDTAIKLDRWLDQSQNFLDLAIILIRQGEEVTAQQVIDQAMELIDAVTNEVQNVSTGSYRADPFHYGRYFRFVRGGLGNLRFALAGAGRGSGFDRGGGLGDQGQGGGGLRA